MPAIARNGPGVELEGLGPDSLQPLTPNPLVKPVLKVNQENPLLIYGEGFVIKDGPVGINHHLASIPDLEPQTAEVGGRLQPLGSPWWPGIFPPGNVVRLPQELACILPPN